MQLLDAAAGKEFKYGTVDIPLEDEQEVLEDVVTTDFSH